MKKLLSTLLSLMFIVGAGNVYAKLTLGGGSNLSTSSKVEDAEKESKTRLANSIKKQADEADQKAAELEKAGNKELSELYKKCSECYKTIATATESTDKSSGSTISKANKDLRDLQKQIRDMEAGVKKPAAPAAPSKKK